MEVPVDASQWRALPLASPKSFEERKVESGLFDSSFLPEFMESITLEKVG